MAVACVVLDDTIEPALDVAAGVEAHVLDCGIARHRAQQVAHLVRARVRARARARARARVRVKVRVRLRVSRLRTSKGRPNPTPNTGAHVEGALHHVVMLLHEHVRRAHLR